MQSVDAYISLGSNLQDPQAQVMRAISELDKIPNTKLLTHSSLYKSKPMGPSDQPNYVNAVANISTFLDAEELLDELQDIESQHQRDRGTERWGPRTLDLDIILYGTMQIKTDRLQVPHSGLAEREFVLIPLQEIQTDLIIPGKGELSSLIKQLPDYTLTKIEIQDVEPQS